MGGIVISVSTNFHISEDLIRSVKWRLFCLIGAAEKFKDLFRPDFVLPQTGVSAFGCIPAFIYPICEGIRFFYYCIYGLLTDFGRGAFLNKAVGYECAW